MCVRDRQPRIKDEKNKDPDERRGLVSASICPATFLVLVWLLYSAPRFTLFRRSQSSSAEEAKTARPEVRALPFSLPCAISLLLLPWARDLSPQGPTRAKTEPAVTGVVFVPPPSYPTRRPTFSWTLLFFGCTFRFYTYLAVPSFPFYFLGRLSVCVTRPVRACVVG